ncbi:MAG: hypothetical protein ABI772_09635 [Bacteroidota bacterium]
MKKFLKSIAVLLVVFITHASAQTTPTQQTNPINPATETSPRQAPQNPDTTYRSGATKQYNSSDSLRTRRYNNTGNTRYNNNKTGVDSTNQKMQNTPPKDK